MNVALLSLGLYVLLASAKFLLHYYTGSAAMLAEAVHSLTDVIGSLLVVTGIALAEKKSERFPWGLYKAENLAALILAGFIFLSAYEIAGVIIRTPTSEMKNLDAGIAALALLALPLSLFARFEHARARVINSPSLMADAAHWKADIAPLIVVTAGLVGARLSYTVMDKIAAAAILIVVVRVGYGIFRDSAKSLLDASLDRRVIDDLRQTVAGFAQVKQILALHARNSGRFVFVYADVTLSVGRLREAHGIACDIEDTIRARVPFVERVTVRYEPEQKETVRYAVPLANSKGLLSEHFGSAPVIAIWDAGAADGSVRSVELLKNPAADREKGKGIGLAQFLIDRKVDVVYTKESFSGKGPDYVLSDADVTVKTTDADTLSALIGPRAPVHSHAP